MNDWVRQQLEQGVKRAERINLEDSACAKALRGELVEFTGRMVPGPSGDSMVRERRPHALRKYAPEPEDFHPSREMVEVTAFGQQGTTWVPAGRAHTAGTVAMSVGYRQESAAEQFDRYYADAERYYQHVSVNQ